MNLSQDPVACSGVSRRSFFRYAAGASALASMPLLTEQHLAFAARPHFADPDVGIHIDANENPMGPSEAARKAMEKVSLNENTIPHEVIGEYDGARVLLRPASPGTGVIAGGGVRAVAEAAGIRDVLAKSLGSSNHANVVKATIAALKSLRRREEIFKVRGIHFSDGKGEQHDASS